MVIALAIISARRKAGRDYAVDRAPRSAFGGARRVAVILPAVFAASYFRMFVEKETADDNPKTNSQGAI
ncbi:MAG: hypothetical protein JWL83_168 [Actinomycetia bacterium]|nr:hypothetical protein [Actinomycetes bacterium]